MTNDFTWSAGLLAGGKSSRMGQDKATILFEGKMLWQRQVDLLQKLSPKHILISGHTDGPYMGTSYRVVLDSQTGLGPLAGLTALLEACETSHLLVLAVDMPSMNENVLQRLLAFQSGVVPKRDGWWEGTVAIYPVSLLPLVQKALHSQENSFQSLIRQGLASGLLQTWELEMELYGAFENLNRPDQLPRR